MDKAASKPPQLSETDKAIIRHLQEDGRRPYAEIAAELGLAPSTVQQRANRLIANGLLKIRAVTDPTLMGMPVVAAVNLQVDGSVIREVARELATFAEVSYVVICAGSCDVQVEVACQDNNSLLNTISKMARVNGVRSTETFVYLQIVKNTYQWGLPPV